MTYLYRAMFGALIGLVWGACVAADVSIQSEIIPPEVMGRMADATAPSGVSVRRWFDPVLENTKYRHVIIDRVVYYPRRPIASRQLGDAVIDHLPVVELHWALHDSATNRLLAAGVRKGVGDAIRKDAPEITIDMLKPVIDAWAGDATDGFARILR